MWEKELSPLHSCSLWRCFELPGLTESLIAAGRSQPLQSWPALRQLEPERSRREMGGGRHLIMHHSGGVGDAQKRILSEAKNNCHSNTERNINMKSEGDASSPNCRNIIAGVLLSLPCAILVGWFLNLHFAQVFAEPHHDDSAGEI